MSASIPVGSTYLLSERGILDIGSKEFLISYLCQTQKATREKIVKILDDPDNALVVNIPLYIPEQGILTNKLQNYAPFCLLQDYHRKTDRYLIINPKISDEVIDDFWSNGENHIN